MLSALQLLTLLPRLDFTKKFHQNSGIEHFVHLDHLVALFSAFRKSVEARDNQNRKIFLYVKARVQSAQYLAKGQKRKHLDFSEV